MPTIDRLDISVYNLYAVRTKMIEQINQQLRLEEAASIPPQLQVLNSYPKMSEIDILLGIVPLHTPWAFFFPPQKLRLARRSPFGFYRVAPSLGSIEDQELLEQKIRELPCKTPEEEKEKQAILACFEQLDKLNELLGFIVGRIGQFLQG